MRKLTLASIAAFGAIAMGPVSPAPSAQLAALSSSEEGKLNYYREPGGKPYCEDDCSGGVCCTFPET